MYKTPLVFDGTRAACEFFVEAYGTWPRDEDVEIAFRIVCAHSGSCKLYEPLRTILSLDEEKLLRFLF